MLAAALLMIWVSMHSAAADDERPLQFNTFHTLQTGEEEAGCFTGSSSFRRLSPLVIHEG
jgi:hypothetical protein